MVKIHRGHCDTPFSFSFLVAGCDMFKISDISDTNSIKQPCLFDMCCFPRDSDHVQTMVQWSSQIFARHTPSQILGASPIRCLAISKPQKLKYQVSILQPAIGPWVLDVPTDSLIIASAFFVVKIWNSRSMRTDSCSAYCLKNHCRIKSHYLEFIGSGHFGSW